MTYEFETLNDIAALFRARAADVMKRRQHIEQTRGRNVRDYHVATALWSTWMSAAEVIEQSKIKQGGAK